MKCDEHEEGCGAYLQVGNLCYIDGSECTFIEGHFFIAVRLLNHLGLRTCKVGYAKVLCNQVHLLCNRIGVVSSIFAKRGDKVFEVNRYTEKEITLEVEEIDNDSATVQKEKQTSTKTKSNKKAKLQKKKSRPNNIGQFHENMRAALATISDQTLHVVHSAFGVANLTMLDGGYPGSQPIALPERTVPSDGGEDDDDDVSEDDESLYEDKSKKRRTR